MRINSEHAGADAVRDRGRLRRVAVRRGSGSVGHGHRVMQGTTAIPGTLASNTTLNRYLPAACRP